MSTSADRRRPPNAGKGREFGSQNKVTRDLKAMVRAALDRAGGVDYLLQQAHENPRAFFALLARLMPLEVMGANGKDLIPDTVVDPTKIAVALLAVLRAGATRQASETDVR